MLGKEGIDLVNFVQRYIWHCGVHVDYFLESGVLTNI